MNKPSFILKKRIILQLFAVFFLFSGLIAGSYLVRRTQDIRKRAQTTPSLPVNEIISPSIGSSIAEEPVRFRIKYSDPDGWKTLKMMGFWIDTQRPSGYRLPYSVHGELHNQGNGIFKYFGERWANGSQVCTNDGLPRHCYKNYAWDVGGFLPGSGAIYMNHDESVTDTTIETANTIGQVKAVSVSEIDSQTVEVVWEVKFGKYFTGKFLKIFISGTRQDNLHIFYPNNPNWHQVGYWNVDRPAREVTYSESFEGFSFSDSFVKDSQTGSLMQSNLQRYLGISSLLVENANFYKDMGSDLSGVLTLYYFDDMNPENKNYIGISTHDPGQWNQTTTHTIFVGVDPLVSTTEYVYKARQEDISGGYDNGVNLNVSDANRLFNTGIKRTFGWHKVSFWVTDVGSWAVIDDLTNNIDEYGLNTIEDYYDTSVKRARIAFDYEMTSFRYIRGGTFNTPTKFFIDEIHLLNLPSLPGDLSKIMSLDHEESLKWANHFTANHLDYYEEITMFGNLEKITDSHCSYFPSSDGIKYCNSWWWNILDTVAQSAFLRFKTTGLPYYKELGNRIIKYILENKDDGWKWAVNERELHASVVGQSFARQIGSNWNLFTQENKVLMREKIQTHLYFLVNLIKESNMGLGLIGDSSAENYSWGPLAGSVYAYIFFNDPEMLDFARVMARKTISTDASAPCETCPGGIVGVKTFYSPSDNVNMQDCSQDPDPTFSQSCLCKGDRALLPGDHDFSYIMDNHDYHPHPAYQRGVNDGINLAAATLMMYGKQVPADFNYNNQQKLEYLKAYSYYDIDKLRIKNVDNIFRLRGKYYCDGRDANDRGPYLDSENVYRLKGTDDWGSKPVFSPNSYILAKNYLGDVVTDSMIERSAKHTYYQFFINFKKPVSPNLAFIDTSCTPSGNLCANSSSSPIYIADRLNSPNNTLLRRNFIDPSVLVPLVDQEVTPEPTVLPPTTTPVPTAVSTSIPTTVPTVKILPGDSDGDGDVDEEDYGKWLLYYDPVKIQEGGSSIGDFNGDSKVDGIDYTIWLNNYTG